MTRRRLCAVRVFATNAIAIYELRACGPACAGRAAQRQSPTLTPGQRRRRRRLDQGAPPHVVQEIVGHSAIEITMTIYAHVSLEEKRKALRKLGDVLG
jgi:integrase